MRRLIILMSCVIALAGCQTMDARDYTNFRAHRPRSILILPPLNETITLVSTYGYLSTVTRPLAELGYYVFPVAVVDQMLKENGMPTAGEMHQVSLIKVAEITGADAVLYPTVKQYGTSYQLVNATTVVEVEARLVDTRSQTLLWEGRAHVRRDSNTGGNIVADAIAAALMQAMHMSVDDPQEVSRLANEELFNAEDRGLLHGPYSPRYDQDP